MIFEEWFNTFPVSSLSSFEDVGRASFEAGRQSVFEEENLKALRKPNPVLDTKDDA